jgi:hypothetical protein
MYRLVQQLIEGNILHTLTREKDISVRYDVREMILEGLAYAVMLEVFGETSVVARRPIAETLGLRGAPFPGQSRPDIAVRYEEKIHVCELKSNRTDYKRFDRVFDNKAFRAYLQTIGDGGQVPWEVEQDLIKLRLYPRLSDNIGSCLFVMVDAYADVSQSWTRVFEDPDVFRATMRTQLVRGWADELLQNTSVEYLETGGVKARLITCVVRAWST